MAVKPYYQFPPEFVWGCATASYQIEGAVREDGRGPSVWDTFSHTPGKTAHDHTGDIACDHYHRYRDDVQLMKWLGLKGYRFSVSWSRVLPAGRGKVNEAGLAFYERLVDELLAHDIQPYMTLFHWDLPQALEDEFGGWESPETPRHFADYAALIAHRLGDRVKHIMTINEFGCFTDLSHSTGQHAPGKKLPPRRRNQVRHHGVLAHGLAVQAIRAHAPRDVQVGLAENAVVCVPAIETEEHIAAARTALREFNAPFMNAVRTGAYTERYLREEGDAAPRFTDAEMAAIGSPIDFMGWNMYAPCYIRATEAAPGFEALPLPASYPRMHLDWLYIGPQIAYWAPRFAKEVWGLDHVVISENGCGSADRLTPDKQVHDTDRTMYVRNHLIAAHRAVAEGWPLKGYFLWSLMDNFEWAEGYLKRFGIVYTHYETLERIPKLSAHFYRETIARGGVA